MSAYMDEHYERPPSMNPDYVPMDITSRTATPTAPQYIPEYLETTNNIPENTSTNHVPSTTIPTSSGFNNDNNKDTDGDDTSAQEWPNFPDLLGELPKPVSVSADSSANNIGASTETIASEDVSSNQARPLAQDCTNKSTSSTDESNEASLLRMAQSFDPNKAETVDEESKHPDQSNGRQSWFGASRPKEEGEMAHNAKRLAWGTKRLASATYNKAAQIATDENVARAKTTSLDVLSRSFGMVQKATKVTHSSMRTTVIPNVRQAVGKVSAKVSSQKSG